VAACQGFGADPRLDDHSDADREDRIIRSSAGDEHFS